MKNSERKSIIQNKKALFDYEILEELDAGIILFGPEVKSLRAGQANLKGSYVTLHSGRPILIGAHIAEYGCNTNKKIDPKRERELLLSKKENFTPFTKNQRNGRNTYCQRNFECWKSF